MSRIIDLSLLIEDNMPTHKLFQRPVITQHLTHESSLALGLGVPGDAMTFQTNFIATLDHVGTHVDAFRHVGPKGASIVLLCTGFHARTYPGLDSVWKNPQLTVEATRWLHARGSRMHGVEGPSTDRPSDNLFPQHRLCRELGISHWEWLVNLEQLVGCGEFQFFGVPLKIAGGSGSPVRAFAMLP
jgi:kynurenine formamidase